MTRLDAVVLLGLWGGVTLLLAELRWFSGRDLVARIAPYLPGHPPGSPRRVGVLSWEGLTAAMGPLAEAIGALTSRLLGVREELDRKLTRIGADDDLRRFRTRQAVWAVASTTAAVSLAAAAGAAWWMLFPIGVGAAVLSWLTVEQKVVAASERWQRALGAELPLVAEQLGMLLSSGYSLNGAIARVAERGRGVSGTAMAGVHRRIRQGIGEVDALRELADLAGVPAVDRLVGVLALNRESNDLGPLIAAEARAARLSVHRDLLASIERRGQIVWIPVTVATLVPGVIFMAVPFVDAIRSLTGG